MKSRTVTEIIPLPRPAAFKDATKKILRVAAYARVSIDHEDQQSSLVAQTEYYEKLISKRPSWKFVKVYVDEGISGLRTDRREGSNRMIEDCLAEDIEIFLRRLIQCRARESVVNSLKKAFSRF